MIVYSTHYTHTYTYMYASLTKPIHYYKQAAFVHIIGCCTKINLINAHLYIYCSTFWPFWSCAAHTRKSPFILFYFVLLSNHKEMLFDLNAHHHTFEFNSPKSNRMNERSNKYNSKKRVCTRRLIPFVRHHNFSMIFFLVLYSGAMGNNTAQSFKSMSVKSDTTYEWFFFLSWVRVFFLYARPSNFQLITFCFRQRKDTTPFIYFAHLLGL